MVPFKLADLIPNVLYKLSMPFTYSDENGKLSEFTKEEKFLYCDDGLLHALEDGVLVSPRVLQKAKIDLLPPSKWEEAK